MKMFKKMMSLLMALAATSVFAAPTVSDVTVEPRGFPWDSCNEVNVRFSVSGIETNSAYFLGGTARNLESGAEKPLPSLGMRIPSNGVYRVVWDAKSDLGPMDVKRMQIALGIEPRKGVQLWGNGPYWAETNIGAENPWDAGYYFWWGDTLGYKREGNQWVASDDSVRGYQFSEGNTPTYNKDNNWLQQNGWITSAGNLTPEHDAACAHWGGGWRMPTPDEIQALVVNTTTLWTTTNGVLGRLVKGKGAYSSATIFLSAAGCGNGNGLTAFNSEGGYWSSTPYSTDSHNACNLFFYSEDFRRSCHGGASRSTGESVRPVREFSEGTDSALFRFVEPTWSNEFALNTRVTFSAAEADFPSIAYDPGWGNSNLCSVAIDGEPILSSETAGSCPWNPQQAGRYVFTHTSGMNVLTAEVQVVAAVADVAARQRYPWNNLVDIDYTVFGVTNAEPYSIRISAEDKVTGETYVAETFESAPLAGNGRHRATWDPVADVGLFSSSNVIYNVMLREKRLDNIVAYYPFEKSMLDDSGNGNHLFASSPITWCNGVNGGRAVCFSGKQVLTLNLAGGHNCCNPLATNNFTVAFWARPTADIYKSFHVTGSEDFSLSSSTVPYVLFPVHGGVNTKYVGIGIAVGRNGVAVTEHAGGHLPTLIAYHSEIGEQWIHVAVTISNNGGPVLYVNGKEVARGASTGRIKFILGGSGEGIGGGWKWLFKGGVDDFIIYDYSLSKDQIEILYAKQKVTAAFPYMGHVLASASSPSVPMRIETGLRMVKPGETVGLTYSDLWDGAAGGPATLTVNGATIHAFEGEGSHAWTVPPTAGRYLFTHSDGDTVLEGELLVEGKLLFAVHSDFGVTVPAAGEYLPEVGTSITAVATSPYPVSDAVRKVCAGWTGTGSVPASGAGTNVTFTLKEESSLAWKWGTQYRLQAGTPANGTLSAEPGWYDDGARTSMTASPSTHYRFLKWTGDVEGCRETGPRISIPMDRPRTIGAAFEPILFPLDVASAFGEPSPSSGRQEIQEGTAVTASVSSPVVIGDGMTNCICTGWTGTGDVPAGGTGLSTSFTITQGSSITWNWRTQYRLAVDIAGQGQTTWGSDWVAPGETVTVTASAGNHYRFARWEGDVDGCRETGPRISVPMTQGRRIRAVFEPVPVTLAVVSEHGSPVPGRGVNKLGECQEVSAAVERSVFAGGTTNYVCTGWTGTGSVPASGTGTNAVFMLEEPSSLTWNWTTNYHLSVTCAGDGEADFTGGWLAAGETHRVSLSPHGEGIGVVSVEGDLEGVVRGDGFLLVPMDRARAIAVTFEEFTVGLAVDAEEMDWTTDAASPFVPQRDVTHDGVDAVRGETTADQTDAQLETTVRGPGTLTFWWKCGQGGCDFWDNGRYVTWVQASEGTVWKQVSREVPAGEHVLSWVPWDTSASVVYLDQVVWTPDRTTTTEVPVPCYWLDGFGLAPGGDYEAAANAQGANGRPVWESYVLGLDPTNPVSKFVATISVADDTATITWEPDLNDGAETRLYKVWGKKDLADDEWHHPARTADRFFRVTVELPNGEDTTDNSGLSVPTGHKGVQLWENGPYWAETNIGAEKPWDAGYYFWWGDTLGYKREGGQWGASDGSASGFLFTEGNTPTYGKDTATLQSEGWITSAGNLAPEHDAACVHWGDGWRMPTADEIDALIAHTTTESITTNGVPGQLVKGKGAYSSASIFLPFAGFGYGGTLNYSESYGSYWSSTSTPGSPDTAWIISFDSKTFDRYDDTRNGGQPLRPLRGSGE